MMRVSKHQVFSPVIGLFILFVLSGPAIGTRVDVPCHKEGELLVQMQPGTPANAALEIHSAVGATVKKRLGR